MGATNLTGTEFARANKNEGNYNIAWVGSYELLSQDPVANTSTLRLYGSMYTDSSTNVRSSNSTDIFKVNGVTISPPTPSAYRYSSNQTYGYSVNRYYSLFGSTDLTVQHNANGSFPSQTISIYANDYHHNAQSASGTISGIASIDRSAPTISISLDSRTDTSLKVKATADANCDVWYYSTNNGSTWTQFSTTNGTTATATITGLTKGTTYSIKIKARKTLNHVEGTSSTGSYTTTDSTPPTVSASTSSVTANSCTLSASADVNCNKWEYSTNGGTSWVTFSTTNGTSASTTISGLSPATAYTITVRATRTSNSVTGTTTTTASTLGFSTFATLSNTNTGSSNVFTFYSYSGSFYFRVQYKLGNTVLVTENIGKVTANTTKTYTSAYTFPHSLLPNAVSGTVTATLYTCSDPSYQNLIGSDTKTFTLSVPSSVKPSISSVTLTPYNTNIWISTRGYWVGGYTRADVETVATAEGTGATIASIVATGDITGSGASFRSEVLSAGNKSIIVTVTDSRGRTAVLQKTQTVQNYTAPAVTIGSVQRGIYSGGNWTASDSGEHIRVQVTGAVSLSGNVCTLHCTCVGNGNTYTGTSITGTSATWYFTQTDSEHVYTINVWATDSVGTVGNIVNYTVSTAETPFSWDYDRIGVGGIPRDAKTFEVADNWALRAYGKNNVFAHLPYSDSTAYRSGNLGWIRIATITITGTWVAEPITFTCTRLLDNRPVTLYLRFPNVESSDPSAPVLYYDDMSSGVFMTNTATTFNAFVIKLATSMWGVYVQKCSEYDHVTVQTYIPPYMLDRCRVEYIDAGEPSVPAGAIMAAPLPYGDLASTNYPTQYNFARVVRFAIAPQGSRTITSSGECSLLISCTGWASNIRSGLYYIAGYSDSSRADVTTLKSASGVTFTAVSGSLAWTMANASANTVYVDVLVLWGPPVTIS